MRHALLKLLCAAALLPATQALLAAPEARVIVKFKADSPLMRKQAFAEARRAPTRAQALADRLGLPLRSGLAIAEDTQVVLASGMASADLAQRLSAQGDVEYAVVDGRKRRLAAPNDPRYARGPAVNPSTQTGGPVAGQWYLRASDATLVSATNAEAAWDITTGSAGIVVAVIDTGVRFDHPDLLPVGQGGNLLPGYDMISDALISNKGGATRSNDASDPGDWIDAGDAATHPDQFGGCTSVEPSSWHGTQVSGIIAASTDNGVGMASMGRTVRVVPVRALGKCGGFDSDIVAAMRWAGGLTVSGVPANPNPARVINMSLGGGVGCAPSYRDAVTALTAAGVTIVAAAGNEAGTPVSEPAACAGVIAVAGVRHAGTKVGFSNMGPEVSLSAPGGNCVNTASGTPCLYPILTTANSGVRTPVTNANGGSIYTDAFNATIGTSFSSPLVAGAAALMLSVQPGLTPAEVRSLLRSTTRAFPTSGADVGVGEVVNACPAPQAGVDVLQCYCTATTCGAGMLDAGAAVLAAAGAQARISFSPATGTIGQPVTLSSVSLVPAGRTISAYQWTLTDGGGIVSSFTGATNGATASLTPVAAGSFTVSLSITDSGGVVTTATQTVSVQAVAPPPPPPGDSGGGGALGLGWLLALALAVLALRLLRRRRA